MSTNIDSLDIQIKTSAGSATVNIEKLATSLGKLKENSNLTKVTNSLTKLSASLASLSGVAGNLSGLDALEKAMNGLAGIQKLTGLNSAISALKKLPSVMSSLDSVELAAFTTKMKQLTEALEPLATRIDKVSAGFSKLPSRMSQVVSMTNSAQKATKSYSDSLDTTSINIMAVINNLQALEGAITWVVNSMANFLAQAIEWDGIQFRFGRAFGEDAEEAYDWVLKVNEALGINIQEFMQYSSLYGSLLSGFGMAQETITTISIGLTELSYDIWAAYNDRFKSLEDASEAVRSAITGEIEPIRNAGIALTEASMQEYLDSIGMANYSIEKLTEAQKSEVRYAVMVNSAMNQGIVGTYAREMITAEGAVRNLSQQIKTLVQSIGSLFIPILSAVLPWITAFVELMYEAAAAIAGFFGIDMFKIDWGESTKGAEGISDVAKEAGTAGSALDDAAGAAKKLKDYTMGFDELNVIDPDAGASGGSGGSGGAGGKAGGGAGGLGLDLDTLWDQALLDQATKKVDEIKEKITGFFEEWQTEIALITGALATMAITALLSQLGEALGWGDKFLGVLKIIKSFASTVLVVTLQFAFQKAAFESFMSGGGLMEYIKALLIGGISTGILYSMWGPTGLVIGLGVTAVASLSAIIENGGIDSVEGVVTALTGIAAAAGAIAIAWKKLGPAIKASQFGAFISLLKEGNSIGSVLSATFPGVAKVLGPVAKAIGTFVSGLTAGSVAVAAGIIVAIASTAYFLAKNWDKVKTAAKKFFDLSIAPQLEKIKDSWDKMKEALAPIGPAFDAIKTALAPVLEWFEGLDFSTVLSGIAKGFEWLGAVLFGTVSTVIAGAISTLVSLIENGIQVFSGLVQIVSGVVQAIVNLFQGDLTGALDAVKLIGSGIVDVFSGLWGLVADPVVAFFDGVVNWFTALWDELVGHSIVPDTIDAIVEWFVSLPDKIFGPIEDFVTGIIDRFKQMWTDIQSWWSSNVAPKFTLEYWKAKFDVIRNAISTKLDEVKTAMSEKWTAIKSWWSTNVAAKFTLDFWKGKFDTIRQAISDKLGEVKTAISNKWTEIKDWFNTNIKPKFTLQYWLDTFTNLKEGFVQTIRNMLNSGIDLINTFIGWLNDKMNFSWDAITIAGQEIVPAGNVQLFTIPTITQRFADGGFIEDGLFTMNHGEIAGRFNNGKSVVANNQQIIEGISAGVYAAVVAAMAEYGGNGESQSINVYLDGKQITASVEKNQRERGRQILAGGLI